jgi:hypothetical protein
MTMVYLKILSQALQWSTEMNHKTSVCDIKYKSFFVSYWFMCASDQPSDQGWWEAPHIFMIWRFLDDWVWQHFWGGQPHVMCINSKQQSPITSLHNDGDREGLWNLGLLLQIGVLGSVRCFVTSWCFGYVACLLQSLCLLLHTLISNVFL